MYHTIGITGLDQKIHKFLWRECKASIPPDILVTTSASFGDRPAGNITTVALRETAEMGRKISPLAVEALERGTYVDDIIDSFNSPERAENVKENIKRIIQPGGFKIKK